MSETTLTLDYMRDVTLKVMNQLGVKEIQRIIAEQCECEKLSQVKPSDYPKLLKAFESNQNASTATDFTPEELREATSEILRYLSAAAIKSALQEHFGVSAMVEVPDRLKLIEVLVGMLSEDVRKQLTCAQRLRELQEPIWNVLRQITGVVKIDPENRTFCFYVQPTTGSARGLIGTQYEIWPDVCQSDWEPQGDDCEHVALVQKNIQLANGVHVNARIDIPRGADVEATRSRLVALHEVVMPHMANRHKA